MLPNIPELNNIFIVIISNNNYKKSIGSQQSLFAFSTAFIYTTM